MLEEERGRSLEQQLGRLDLCQLISSDFFPNFKGHCFSFTFLKGSAGIDERGCLEISGNRYPIEHHLGTGHGIRFLNCKYRKIFSLWTKDILFRNDDKRPERCRFFVHSYRWRILSLRSQLLNCLLV